MTVAQKLQAALNAQKFRKFFYLAHYDVRGARYFYAVISDTQLRL